MYSSAGWRGLGLGPLVLSSPNMKKTKSVLDYFRVNTYHLLGHGTGAGAALELGRSMGKACPRPPGPELEAVLSVTLASPVLGDDELTPDFLDTLRAPYTKGGNEVRASPGLGGGGTEARVAPAATSVGWSSVAVFVFVFVFVFIFFGGER